MEAKKEKKGLNKLDGRSFALNPEGT